jgi:hypothetical protein
MVMEKKDKTFNSVYNFIVNFRPEEIEEVIADIKLAKGGKKFLYALDTFDIIAHYLPYIDESFFSASSKNELAQKLICYDYFFNSPVPKNIIILDEYKMELLSAKNRIQRQLKDTRNIVKTLEILKRDTAVFTNREAMAEDYFEKNFELILLLLILSEKKDFIHTEFENFLKNKIVLDEIKTGSLSDDELINEVFRTTQHSKLSKALFKEYVDDNKFDLISIPKPEERYVYLENTYRDIQAIDRILNLNEKLSVNTDYFVIYLSSTPTKTRKIFKSLNNLQKKEPNQRPSNVEGRTIHRNIYQCFLFDILKNEYALESESILEALQSLKKLSIKLGLGVQSSEPQIDEQDIAVLQRLKNIFDVYSSDLDNHFYLKIYEKYKHVYQTMRTARNPIGAETKNQQIKDIDIMSLFSLVDDFLNNEDFKKKLFDLNNTVIQIKQTIDIRNIFFSDQLFAPNLFFGKDVIKNNFHHLPYLLFLNVEIEPGITDKLTELLDYLIQITHPDHNAIGDLMFYLKNVIGEFSDNSRPLNVLSFQQIVLCYLNLLVIPSENPNAGIQKEREIIIALEKQNQIFSSIFFEQHIEESDDNRNLIMNFRPNIYAKEIEYLLLWLYRRNEKIDEGIVLGKELIASNPTDPRFFHGLGLCYIAKSYEMHFADDFENREEEEIMHSLSSAIKNLETAANLYQEMVNEDYENTVNNLLCKNLIAVLNSLADTSIRIYQLSECKQLDRLQKATTYFTRLIQMAEMCQINYSENNTFLSTEMEIEYFEARQLFSQMNKWGAHSKITSAQEKMLILEKRKEFDITHTKFRNIEKDMNLLAIKIYQSL